VDILEINLLIQRDNLKNGKWKKPIPAFKGASYEILQLFNKKFSIQTQNYKTVPKTNMVILSVSEESRFLSF
jgi:hypothetical protein